MVKYSSIDKLIDVEVHDEKVAYNHRHTLSLRVGLESYFTERERQHLMTQFKEAARLFSSAT